MTNDLLNTLIKSVQMASKPKTSPYDSTAVVKRVEDGVAWVQIPGGVDETPVKLTVNAEAGDTVQVRVSGGTAFLVGNATAPPTDDKTANAAKQVAIKAQEVAGNAVDDLKRAKDAADSAQQSANNANKYASQALSGLSTVQSVAETLTWITQHGTMTLTTDTEIDPTHVYFVQDTEGDYVVGNVHYSVVAEPKAADLATYYVLSIDESLNNYVATHLAVTEEGLWVLPAATGYKVLIATGQGTQYTTAGTYIIDASGNTVARFGTDVQIGAGSTGYTAIDSNGMRVYRGVSQLANIGYGEGNVYSGGTENAPYYSLGNRVISAPNYSASKTYLIGDKVWYDHEVYVCIRNITTAEAWDSSHWLKVEDVRIGAYSMAEGYHTAALRQSDHAEGRETFAQGNYAHAEGFFTVAGTETTQTALAAHAEGMHTAALDTAAHAEGRETIASGGSSHAQNRGTIAAGAYQTALGKYNIEDTNNKYAAIIGNGTADDARSNAFTVDWDGNAKAAGHVSGTTEQLTITRTENSYIGATNMALLRAVRKDGMLWFNGNINLSSAVPTGTGLTEIAQISGWSSAYTISATMAGQTGGGAILVTINTNGSVQIANGSGASATGFHRCPMVVPATN